MAPAKSVHADLQTYMYMGLWQNGGKSMFARFV